jgi:hypothetical protein
MDKTYHLGIIIIVFFALLLTRCRRQTENTAGPPEKITIACDASNSSVLVQVASMKKFITAENVSVTPQPSPVVKIALTSVLDGKADLTTVAETPLMFVILIGKNYMPWPSFRGQIRTKL